MLKMNQENNKIKKNDFLFLPLGGSGEIGMNCNLYHLDGSWLMIDLGVTFKDDRVPNADIILPNLDFIIKQKEKLVGIILTHAHEDHIGAVPYVYEKFDNVPIYTTPFTSSVLKRKFISQKIEKAPNIKLLEYNKNIKIKNFNIEILSLTHSIPEPNAVIIKSSKGNIFHSGDWKIDPSPLVGNPIDTKKLKKIKNEGVCALVCDSTNVFNLTPSGSEKEVRKALDEIFKINNKGQIIITCFASNIARLETIGLIAEKYERSCVFLGRSLKRIYDSAIENKYLTKVPKFLNENEGKLLPSENTVLICTGSQGESRAALYKLANNQNPKFSINKEDLVIFSSREIPGNEKQISLLKNQLIKIGCKFIDHRNHKVHVSGHPSQKELSQMYNWLKPDLLIPVHGEFRHLNEHFKFALNSGVKNALLVENGDLIKINKNGDSRIIDQVTSGRMAVMGKRVLPINKKIFNYFKNINLNGCLQIVLVIDQDENLIVDPIIFSETLFDENDIIEKRSLKEDFKKIIKIALSQFINDDILEKNLRGQFRKKFNEDYGIRPVINLKIVKI